MLSFPDFKEKNIIVVFSNEKESFCIKNDNLIVKNEDDNIILQTTCYRIFTLWIVGHGVITLGLLERSKKFAFPIYLLSHNYRCIGHWSTAVDGNFLLRQKQYSYKETNIAQLLIENKLYNQIQLLKSIRQKTEQCKNSIKIISEYYTQLNSANDFQTILGIEGVATRVYFSQWFVQMNWHGRKPRAKQDIINVLLDIGYTFLFYFIESMLNLYGFDIYQGVYHRLFYQRKSLVCDLVEPFRCIIDRQIKNAYNLGQIKPDDFIILNGQYCIKYNKNKEYTHWLLESVLEYKSDIFLYCQIYYRAFMREKLIQEYPYFKIDEPFKK